MRTVGTINSTYLLINGGKGTREKEEESRLIPGLDNWVSGSTVVR